MTYKIYPFPAVPENGSLDSFLRAARSQLPFIEGPNNLTPYAAMVGHAENLAWCQTFLCACAEVAGVKLPANTASTYAMANAFRAAGRWGAQPKVGAFGFIYIASLGRIGHVFTVEALRDPAVRSVVSIEGNTDVRGGRTGGRVMRHVRTTVVGYGYPDYQSITLKPAKVDLLLKRGMNGQQVLNVQNALIPLGNHFAKPGFFDDHMEDVVKLYQQHRGLKVTGQVDQATWKRLRQKG